MHELFVDFAKAYDSVKRKVLYDVLLEFDVTKKLLSPCGDRGKEYSHCSPCMS
jgi:hypothetical protein